MDVLSLPQTSKTFEPWRPFYTLYVREVLRFMKIPGQTLIGPIFTSALYMVMLRFALGGSRPVVYEVDYLTFVFPGIMMMTLIQGAFTNTSSSLFQMKIMEVLPELIVAPIGFPRIFLAFIFGTFTRSLIVFFLFWGGFSFFFPLLPVHPAALAFFLLSGVFIMGCIGITTAQWASKFDQLASVTTFVVIPLSFLSGTFFSIGNIPPVFQLIAHFDPLFYMIDGFRYGFLGITDFSMAVGYGVIGMLDVLVGSACFYFFWKAKGLCS